MGKIKVLLSEEDLMKLFLKGFLGDEKAELADKILKMLKSQGIDDEKFMEMVKQNKPFEPPSDNMTNTFTNLNVPRGELPQLNLNNPLEFETYAKIADRFISGRSANLLGIRGEMLADAAKNALNKFGKYVPVELALAQLAAEGGFSANPKSRPIRTKNPFNVGNVDSGKNVYHPSVQSGIQRYYDLIAKNYITKNKSASDLLRNFVNKDGNRYASGRSYENLVSKIANQVGMMGQPLYASLGRKLSQNMA